MTSCIIFFEEHIFLWRTHIDLISISKFSDTGKYLSLRNYEQNRKKQISQNIPNFFVFNKLPMKTTSQVTFVHDKTALTNTAYFVKKK